MGCIEDDAQHESNRNYNQHFFWKIHSLRIVHYKKEYKSGDLLLFQSDVNCDAQEITKRSLNEIENLKNIYIHDIGFQVHLT